jgi:hypothetical protein
MFKPELLYNPLRTHPFNFVNYHNFLSNRFEILNQTQGRGLEHNIIFKRLPILVEGVLQQPVIRFDLNLFQYLFKYGLANLVSAVVVEDEFPPWT